MNRIPRWLVAVAVTVGIGLVTPSIVEAQCLSCNSLSGYCEPDPWYGADSCVGGNWDGEPWCASWGGLECDPRVTFNDLGPDGALPSEEVFASFAPGAPELSSESPTTRYVRDCSSRIVGRSYASDEAADMRRRTESIAI